MIFSVPQCQPVYWAMVTVHGALKKSRSRSQRPPVTSGCPHCLQCKISGTYRLIWPAIIVSGRLKKYKVCRMRVQTNISRMTRGLNPRGFKMVDPPWALPPDPDINPPRRGLDYALWAVDTSREPLSLAAPTGFNVAVAFAPNSNSQLALQANFTSASPSQTFCSKLPPFQHIYPQSTDYFLVGLLIASAYIYLHLYSLSLKRTCLFLPFRHLYPQLMDCSLVERLTSAARVCTPQRIAVIVGFLGILVTRRRSMAHSHVDLPGHSQHNSMLLIFRHFYPQSMDCSPVGLLIASAYVYLYLNMFSSFVKPNSTLPPLQHLYPQSMDCSLVRRLTASAQVYLNLPTWCLQALKCSVCHGRNLSLQQIDPEASRTTTPPALDSVSGMPLVANVTRLRFALAV